MKLPWRLAPITLALLLALSAPLSGEERSDEAILDCSLINLIATPERYHEKKVRVMGYVVIEFERHALFLSETDSDRSLTRNGVWLQFGDRASVEAHKEMNRGYVIVVGIFDMNMRGHGSMYSGSIQQIERMDRWR